MQDSDSEAILSLIEDDLYTLFEACSIGSFSDEYEYIKQNNGASVSVVLSCSNKNNKENVISGLDNISDNVTVSFYPTVTKNKYMEYEASSGSVVVLSSKAMTSAKAARVVYDEIESVNYEGKKYRKDICPICL